MLRVVWLVWAFLSTLRIYEKSLCNIGSSFGIKRVIWGRLIVLNRTKGNNQSEKLFMCKLGNWVGNSKGWELYFKDPNILG